MSGGTGVFPLLRDYDALVRRKSLELDIPKEITENLSPKIVLRPYQMQAVARFRRYMNDETCAVPVQLLFEMATGSGKTAVMAALILDLYTRGYRNFLFFVNSAQIVEKTKANFLDPNASKHLFARDIRIGEKRVALRAVSNFDESHPDAINIHFTTIQGLHARMLRPRENDMTPEDFEDTRVVLISDEAHHMSAETKSIERLTKGDRDARLSWEGTVNEIMSRNPENMLLEFSATADLENQAIQAKYNDRLIYRYDLKGFRADGYSKDIELRRVDLPPHERMLQAVILSQYRRKVAEGHGIRCKPVILMKSQKIAESKDNEEVFHDLIAKLDGALIEKLRDASQGDETLADAFDLILVDRAMNPDDFAQELRLEFAPEKVVNVNDPKDLEARQILLNTLEDRNNEIRVIFAVDRLNEGWDVLNLFDIVRLYDKRDGKGDKVGKTTMSEAQLIGRGARYYPFANPEDADLPLDRRKFDNDTENPLRVLEQLHYHCSHNPRYIDDIKKALRNVGLLDENEGRKTVRVKDSFKETGFYKSAILWKNERRPNAREDVLGLADYMASTDLTYSGFMSGRVIQVQAFGEVPQANPGDSNQSSRLIDVDDLGKQAILFAMDCDKFFHFDNLKSLFPNLHTRDEFITSKEMLGACEITLRGPKRTIIDLSADDCLVISRFLLDQIKKGVSASRVDYKGTTEFTPEYLHKVLVDRHIKIGSNGESGRSWSETEIEGLDHIDLHQEDWHVFDDSYGTDQEKLLIRFVHDNRDRLLERYEEFYLVRNEKMIKIFSFDEGRAFEPDFVLFLREKNEDALKTLQVFIEPKMAKLIQAEAWKSKFLKQLAAKSSLATLFQDREYRILGLPFYNSDPSVAKEFSSAFGELVD